MQSDVIIIGGGFAGTAAAITLARANRNVQVIDSGTPRNRFSEHSHGVLGLDGVAPTELLERGHAELQKFGGNISHDTVESLSRPSEQAPWQIRLTDDTLLESRHALVATGLTDKLPDVPGLSELWGTRIFHCPYCHGHEVKGKKVVLIGGANPPFTIRISKLLSKWTSALTFYTNGLELTGLDRTQLAGLGVEINDAKVTQVPAGSGLAHRRRSTQCRWSTHLRSILYWARFSAQRCTVTGCWLRTGQWLGQSRAWPNLSIAPMGSRQCSQFAGSGLPSDG